MAFATSRDERAFATLAKRYSGLIYQTALRALGDSMLAEDVSQRVLRALAAKAGRLAHETAPLSSWLHRATILEAKAAYRSELRHQRRKEIPMHESAASEPDPAWRQALPLMDRAIDALPESDRQVLLLHYFDGLTFPQIAERLGKSAAAVQKQSRRTLLALQRTLGRRGITLSVALLATGLTSEFAKAAPAFALPALPAAGKATLLAMKPTTALAATLLLCGIPLAMQHHTIRELEKLAAVSAPITRSRSAVEKSATASVSPIRRLISDLKAKDHDLPRYLRALDALNTRSPEEISELVRQLVAGELSVKDRNLALLAVFRSLAKMDPRASLDLMLQEVPGEYFCEHYAIHPIFTETLGDWAHSDPIAAYRWFRDHTTLIRDFLSHDKMDPGYLENNLRTFQIGQFLIFASPADAIELFKDMPMHERMNKLGNLGLTPGDTFHTKLRNNPDPFIEVARGLFSEQDAARLIANAAQAGFAGFPDQRILGSAADFIDQRKLSLPEIEEIALRAGTDFLATRAKPNSGDQRLADGIVAYRQWLDDRGIEGTDHMIGQALGKIKSGDLRTASQMILHYEQHGLSEDAVIGFLETSPRGLDEKLLREIAGKLNDPSQADRLIKRVIPR
jgi:RNA polymerase sigma-70 factor (ECF subfamily)